MQLQNAALQLSGSGLTNGYFEGGEQGAPGTYYWKRFLDRIYRMVKNKKRKTAALLHSSERLRSKREILCNTLIWQQAATIFYSQDDLMEKNIFVY